MQSATMRRTNIFLSTKRKREWARATRTGRHDQRMCPRRQPIACAILAARPRIGRGHGCGALRDPLLLARHMNGGWEWIVDGEDALASRLGDLPAMQRLAAAVVEALGLQVIGVPQWHQFPGPGGVTGLFLLSESHFTVHTFPESGVITVNLYSCRERNLAERAVVARALRMLVEEAAAAKTVRLTELRRGALP